MYSAERYIKALQVVVEKYKIIAPDSEHLRRAREMLAGLECATPGWCRNYPCECRTVGKPSGCHHGWHECSPQIYHRDIAEQAAQYLTKGSLYVGDYTTSDS